MIMTSLLKPHNWVLYLLFFSSSSYSMLESPVTNAENSDDIEIKRSLDYYEFHKAKSIKRVNPKYPSSSAAKGQEGWVELNFGVDEKGKVKDIVVIDSSGSRHFEKSAKKAVAKWRYDPALKNGKPVYSCQNKVRLEFIIDSNHVKAVGKKFKPVFEQASSAFNNGDLAKAESILEELSKKQTWTNYETTLISRLAYALYKKSNKIEKAEYFANQAISRVRKDESLFDDDLFMIMSKIETSAQLGNVSNVQSVYKKYLDEIELDDLSDQGKKLIKRIDYIKQQVDDYVDSNDVLVRYAYVNKLGTAHHQLLRNSFTIDDKHGAVERLQIRCDGKFTEVDSITKDEVFNIPPSWGECGVTFFGDEHSTFKIIEASSKI